MSKKSLSNILLIGLLSIFILPTNLFAMKKAEEKTSQEQINDILTDLQQDQDQLVTDLLDSFMERICPRTSRTLSIIRNRFLEPFLDQNSQNLNNKIKNSEAIITNILNNSPSLGENEKLEFQNKLQKLKHLQLQIDRNVIARIALNPSIKVSKARIYECWHDSAKSIDQTFKEILGDTVSVYDKFMPKDANTLTYKFASEMYSLCQALNENRNESKFCVRVRRGRAREGDKWESYEKWLKKANEDDLADDEKVFRKELLNAERSVSNNEKKLTNKQKALLKKLERLVSSQEELDNPSNAHWLRPYLWPTTKITLCASGAILALVLTSKLLGWR